ncbi:reverse transcriptase domain-containing protein [Tanacetum coccineum]
MIMMEGSRKRPFEEGRFDMMNKLTFPTIPRSQLTNEPIILEGIIEGNQVRRILVDGGSSSDIMYEHCFRNLDVSIWSRLRRCKALMTGEGLIRKVLPPKWITNAIPIKLTNETWKVQMDYSGLNKACAKDMYPLLEEGEELASLMGHPYKCFLQHPKEYNQIRMAEEDEEKTGFQTKEGVYCFTHMPKELKNSAAKLQRMMEKVLTNQRGQNVEIYLEEIVIKSKSEPDMVQDVKEILRKLKRVNIKINPAMSSFGVKEGRFLSYIVTEEGLRADPGRIQAIILSPTPRKTIEEGSGVGIILVSPEKRMHSYAIRLKFNTSDHAIDYEALLAGLAASVSKGMKDLHVFMDSPKLVAQTEENHMPVMEQERKFKKEIMDATAPFHKFRITHLPIILNSKAEVLTGLAAIKLEFLNQEVSVGIKTRPSVEETSSSKKGKASTNVPGAKPNYNWEASGSN